MADKLDQARRRFLAGAGGLAGILAGSGLGSFARAAELAPTPTCNDADEPTHPQTAGPYFKPNSPLRSSFVEAAEKGELLHLSGRVLTTSCKPVANTLLEFWHADAQGQYDLKGFRHRGHLFSDDAGFFEIKTILPGAYAGRTRHIHARAQARNGKILTTQLYFPNESQNRMDALFDPALVMSVRETASALEASFNFVLSV